MAWIGATALMWPMVFLLLFLLGNAPRATTGGIRRMLQPTTIQGTLLTKYLSNTELEAHLNDYVRRCSKVARLIKWGKSAEGVDLLALHISSQPQLNGDVAKPQFKYVGNIHGDEPSGRQLLLMLAERLCQGYPSEKGVKHLVDSVELFIIPTMNPDGFAAHRRENKGNIDLNRNFPDPVHQKGKDLRVTVGQEQPETRAMMNFTLSHRFVASLSFHEGALVANYPFDGYADGDLNVRGEKHMAPDDAGFVMLAQLYAKKHTTMATSKEFQGGITNGAQWYPLYGGMQDWNYMAADCMEVTLELNDQKWPELPRLAAMWGENEKALLEYPLVTLSGVHGRVMGEGPDGVDIPLAATLMIQHIQHNSSSSARFGDYYKILPPGTYQLTAIAPKFKSATATITVPSDGSGMVKDFRLEPLVPYPRKPPALATQTGSHRSEREPQEEWVMVHGGPHHLSAGGVSSFTKIGAIVIVQVLAVGAFLAWRRYAKEQQYTQLLSPSSSPTRPGYLSNRVTRTPV